MQGQGPPDTLTHRHRLAMRLEATGRTVAEVAELSGLSPQHLWRLRQSPLYQAGLNELRTQLDSKVTFDLGKAISDAAEAAWTRHGELMAQSDNLSVAKACVDTVIDRVSPKKTLTEGLTTVTVKISVEQKALIERALSDADAEVEAIPFAGRPIPIEEAFHAVADPPTEDEGAM